MAQTPLSEKPRQRLRVEIEIPRKLIDKARPKPDHAGEELIVPLKLFPEQLFDLSPWEAPAPSRSPAVVYCLRFRKFAFICTAGHEQFAWFVEDEEPEVGDCRLCVGKDH